MIVDEADQEITMAEDPFLEAGINIPDELPYQPSPKSLRVQTWKSSTSIARLFSSNKRLNASKAKIFPSTSTNRLKTFQKKFVSRSGKLNTSQLDTDVLDTCNTSPARLNSPDTQMVKIFLNTCQA